MMAATSVPLAMLHPSDPNDCDDNGVDDDDRVVVLKSSMSSSSRRFTFSHSLSWLPERRGRERDIESERVNNYIMVAIMLIVLLFYVKRPTITTILNSVRALLIIIVGYCYCDRDY